MHFDIIYTTKTWPSNLSSDYSNFVLHNITYSTLTSSKPNFRVSGLQRGATFSPPGLSVATELRTGPARVSGLSRRKTEATPGVTEEVARRFGLVQGTARASGLRSGRGGKGERSLKNAYFPLRRSLRNRFLEHKAFERHSLNRRILTECQNRLELCEYPEKGRGIRATKRFQEGGFRR